MLDLKISLFNQDQLLASDQILTGGTLLPFVPGQSSAPELDRDVIASIGAPQTAAVPASQPHNSISFSQYVYDPRDQRLQYEPTVDFQDFVVTLSWLGSDGDNLGSRGQAGSGDYSVTGRNLSEPSVPAPGTQQETRPPTCYCYELTYIIAPNSVFAHGMV